MRNGSATEMQFSKKGRLICHTRKCGAHRYLYGFYTKLLNPSPILHLVFLVVRYHPISVGLAPVPSSAPLLHSPLGETACAEVTATATYVSTGHHTRDAHHDSALVQATCLGVAVTASGSGHGVCGRPRRLSAHVPLYVSLSARVSPPCALLFACGALPSRDREKGLTNLLSVGLRWRSLLYQCLLQHSTTRSSRQERTLYAKHA